jgi:hypothetical protein
VFEAMSREKESKSLGAYGLGGRYEVGRGIFIDRLKYIDF